jgi:hypothetical protein
MQHLESKTMIGLAVLLASILLLAALGKLTAEAVEAIKWLGGSFMSVRVAANIAENLPGNK